MHVMVESCEQSAFADMKVTIKMYMNVSEMHEWKHIRMQDFMERVERAITREFGKPQKERHRVLLDKE